jgi:hypothetical protein
MQKDMASTERHTYEIQQIGVTGSLHKIDSSLHSIKVHFLERGWLARDVAYLHSKEALAILSFKTDMKLGI